jgi:hypothetical protein
MSTHGNIKGKENFQDVSTRRHLLKRGKKKALG